MHNGHGPECAARLTNDEAPVPSGLVLLFVQSLLASLVKLPPPQCSRFERPVPYLRRQLSRAGDMAVAVGWDSDGSEAPSNIEVRRHPLSTR